MIAEPNIAEAETDRLERHPILAEDLQDQADLERERFNAGWNAAADLFARIAAHDGHKRLADLIRRQRK